MANSATVQLELRSKPECISLVRGMLAAVAERLGFDGELLDDLKTAVSEACNNVVLHAYSEDAGPLTVRLTVRPDAVEVVVRDWGEGIHQVAPTEDRMHVGLALISALADRAEFLTAAGGGTEVRMAFAHTRSADSDGSCITPDEDLPGRQSLDGDVVVTLAPVTLLGGVLGRLARAVAAGARFTLDRFSDLYLVTDAVAAHAANSTDGSHISFALSSELRRLAITVGPFTAGASEDLRSTSTDPESLLVMLADEMEIERVNHHELLRLVMQDRAGAGASEPS